MADERGSNYSGYEVSGVFSYQSVLCGSAATVIFMQQRTVLTFAKFKVSQSQRLKGHDVTF